eukprot:350777-Chlamydomonas_euryale.AAC.2
MSQLLSCPCFCVDGTERSACSAATHRAARRATRPRLPHAVVHHLAASTMPRCRSTGFGWMTPGPTWRPLRHLPCRVPSKRPFVGPLPRHTCSHGVVKQCARWSTRASASLHVDCGEGGMHALAQACT